ncbi:hypothetical protein Efla_006691 [Eimeria flavescens]
MATQVRTPVPSDMGQAFAFLTEKALSPSQLHVYITDSYETYLLLPTCPPQTWPPYCCFSLGAASLGSAPVASRVPHVRASNTQRTSRSRASALPSSSPNIPPLHSSVARSACIPSEPSDLHAHTRTTRAAHPPVVRNSPRSSPRRLSSTSRISPARTHLSRTRRGDHYPLPATTQAAARAIPRPVALTVPRAILAPPTWRPRTRPLVPGSATDLLPGFLSTTRNCLGLPRAPPSRAAPVTTWRSPTHTQQCSARSSPRPPPPAWRSARPSSRSTPSRSSPSPRGHSGEYSGRRDQVLGQLPRRDEVAKDYSELRHFLSAIV